MHTPASSLTLESMALKSKSGGNLIERSLAKSAITDENMLDIFRRVLMDFVCCQQADEMCLFPVRGYTSGSAIAKICFPLKNLSCERA